MGWARLDLAGQTWSLAQARDPVGQQAHMAQPKCALHSAKVIKLHSHCFLATFTQKQREEEDFTW